MVDSTVIAIPEAKMETRQKGKSKGHRANTRGRRAGWVQPAERDKDLHLARRRMGKAQHTTPPPCEPKGKEGRQ